MFCADGEPVLFWYSFHGQYGLSHPLHGLDKSTLTRSTVDVEGEVGCGVTRQILRLFGRHLAVLENEIHKGRPERVEVELPTGCLLRDARHGQIF